AGLAVTPVDMVTDFPEMLDGRVKTLHPRIHAGLLARRDDEAHMATLATYGITPIDLVVVNLYPFKATIQKPAVTQADAIENIDIGGPSMLRSAAKNYAGVLPVVDPTDYQIVLDRLQSGTADEADFRQAMAA
ncbi:bifunctional phosphoribosylaminoimidazolecarboxamide formyltransferase/IMP cyclohydrolase, partial [Lactobacillaceae bacterium KNUT 0156]|nr:bifunctional phosphoribosylaminoimidazolecarboxamide formyltransferase/IMP cyclohydrolase [Weissella cibaria]